MENEGQSVEPLDLDIIYEYSLKMFGDVFESLIGAIFLDSMDIEKTKSILYRILKPYVMVYSDLKSVQDHGRTKLLELWNSKSYTKDVKIFHLR